MYNRLELVKIVLYDAHEHLYIPRGETYVFTKSNLSKHASDLYKDHLPLTVSVNDNDFTINNSAPRSVNNNRVTVVDLDCGWTS